MEGASQGAGLVLVLVRVDELVRDNAGHLV
jgi:hypothetical protein